MKKEIIAALILILLLALSLANAHLINNITSEMSENVTRAEELYFGGETKAAAELVKDTLQIWRDWEKYTQIMLRHEEIELVIEGFFDLLGELEREEGATRMDYERIRVILKGISNAEQVRWGSIF